MPRFFRRSNQSENAPAHIGKRLRFQIQSLIHCRIQPSRQSRTAPQSQSSRTTRHTDRHPIENSQCTKQLISRSRNQNKQATTPQTIRPHVKQTPSMRTTKRMRHTSRPRQARQRTPGENRRKSKPHKAAKTHSPEKTRIKTETTKRGGLGVVRVFIRISRVIVPVSGKIFPSRAHVRPFLHVDPADD